MNSTQAQETLQKVGLRRQDSQRDLAICPKFCKTRGDNNLTKAQNVHMDRSQLGSKPPYLFLLEEQTKARSSWGICTDPQTSSSIYSFIYFLVKGPSMCVCMEGGR